MAYSTGIVQHGILIAGLMWIHFIGQRLVGWPLALACQVLFKSSEMALDVVRDQVAVYTSSYPVWIFATHGNCYAK